MISFDAKHLLFSSQIRSGIEKSRIETYQNAIQEAHQEILSDRRADILGFYNLPRPIPHITMIIWTAWRQL
jgi:hypothetical protein